MRLSPIFLVLLIAVTGCSGPRGMEPITVEGIVTVRGNEPFTAVWLDTDMRTHYVLVLDPAERSALVNPARYRMTGHVYADTWNGMNLAHLDVLEMTRIDRADGS